MCATHCHSTRRFRSLRPSPPGMRSATLGKCFLSSLGFPYAADKDTVARAYPWLADYGKRECEGKLPRREVDKEEFYEA